MTIKTKRDIERQDDKGGIELLRVWCDPVIRKSRHFALQFPRLLKRLSAKDTDYKRFPPILINSFPKSGTHLLSGVINAIPNTQFYGTFWASIPSIPFKERSKTRLTNSINRVAPGETIHGHLFYDPEFCASLLRKNVMQFFIYRDPRDVVVSEAFYLTYMNKWHRLHRIYRAIPSDEDRILFAINGFSSPDATLPYPDIAQRFSRYVGWLRDSNVCSCRFEDLVSEDDCIKTIHQIIAHYTKYSGINIDEGKMSQMMIERIITKRSHTFRSGKSGEWKRVFTKKHKQAIKKVAGQLLIDLDYERDLDW